MERGGELARQLQVLTSTRGLHAEMPGSAGRVIVSVCGMWVKPRWTAGCPGRVQISVCSQIRNRNCLMVVPSGVTVPSEASETRPTSPRCCATCVQERRIADHRVDRGSGRGMLRIRWVGSPCHQCAKLAGRLRKTAGQGGPRGPEGDGDGAAVCYVAAVAANRYQRLASMSNQRWGVKI
jgi:hypothetical protein